MLLLVLFTLLLSWASLNAARVLVAADARQRDVQVFVFAGVLWHVAVVGSLFMLGSLAVLSRLSVGLAVTALSGAMLLAAARRDGGRRPFLDAQRALARPFVELPRRLVRACRYAGLPLWPVVLFAAALLGWFAFAACVSPPLGNNDALFYHEPIVALTLQHGHLGPFDLPAHLQRINGMPRFSHLVQLWFALWSGRTFVEFANILSHPLALAATYGLLRRVGAQKSTSLAWTFCWSVTPGLLRLTPGIMVDVHTAALTMVAIYCVVVPRLTVASAVVAAFACALTLGTKYHVVAITFVLSIALLVRLLARRGEWSPRAFWLTTVSCAGIIFAGLAAVFLRNLILFDNPIWPAGLKIPGLGVVLKSPHDIKDALSSGKGLGPLGILDKWLASPFTEKAWQGESARPEDYGSAGVFLAWPAAMLATARILFDAARRKWRKVPAPDVQGVLLTLASVVVVALAAFPSIVRGRYWLVIFGVYFVLTAWLTHKPRLRPLGRQLSFVATVLMMISAVWMMKADYVPTPAGVWARLQVPASERDFTERQLSTIRPDVGRVRVKEITAGKVVGFDSGYSIGVLWNDDYSNEVVWLSSRDPVAEAERRDVDFLFLHTRTFSSMRKSGEGWEFVGQVLKRKGRHPGRLYRRVRDAKPAPSGAAPSKE